MSVLLCPMCKCIDECVHVKNASYYGLILACVHVLQYAQMFLPTCNRCIIATRNPSPIASLLLTVAIRELGPEKDWPGWANKGVFKDVGVESNTEAFDGATAYQAAVWAACVVMGIRWLVPCTKTGSSLGSCVIALQIQCNINTWRPGMRFHCCS